MNLMDQVAHQGFQMMEFPPLCSKLTTLRLYESSMTPDTLTKLLSYTPALKTLDYEPFSAPRLEESIPSSMKKLCFTDDFFGDAWGAEELTSVLNDFVEGDWGASAPQLQQIYVAIDREWLGEAEDDCLRKLCEENGLRYKL
ncbi:unnamed protein product [Alternaria alternata]